MTGRSVSLVVCDGAGDVLGQIEPFEVETPWWQDTEPIGERFGSLHVLRLLQVLKPGAGCGGQARYLAEAREGTRRLPLAPCAEVLGEHPLRMPWARPGGPAADLEWAAGIVQPSGPPTQHRTWNLSSIWSFPAGGATAWLKCVPGFFRHEAAVLRLLAGGGAPELLAADGHRILLAEFPGSDGFHATLEDKRRLIDHLVELQLRTAPLTSDLLGAGVPDARWPCLVDELAALVRRRAPQDPHLQRLLDDAVRLGDEIGECGLRDVLVHGDAHAGNARIGIDPPIWFDWGDSRVGHPLLDLAVLSRLPGEEAEALERYWLQAWARAEVGTDPATAWRLLQPLAVLRQAAVYQGFLDNIEPSERIYHEGDVMPALLAASQLAAKRPAQR